MLLLLIYEILVDLALPIAADAATRASVATLATAATVTAAANGLVSSKSRRGYFAAVLSSSSSLTLFHSYSLAIQSGFCIVLGHRLCSCEGVGQ